MPYMAHAKHQFKARRGQAFLARQARIVYQQVQRQIARQEGGRALVHRRQVAQIQRQKFGLGRASRAARDVIQNPKVIKAYLGGARAAA